MFIYFIQTKSETLLADEIGRSGIAYAFEGPGQPAQTQTYNGPDGNKGIMLIPDGAKWKPIHDAKTQAWRRVPGTVAWVGMSNEDKHRPLPETLRRAQMANGYWYTLGDGNEWACPTAMHLDGESALPTSLDLDDAGAWTRSPNNSIYKELWGKAQSLYDHVFGELEDGVTEWDVAEYAPLAVDALAVNYRVGPAECALLGLLNEQTIPKVLGALIELPLLQEASDSLKKKGPLPEDFSCPPGVKDSIQDSAQPLESSTD